jgi:transcriptional regulator with XRE-family HTH domain
MEQKIKAGDRLRAIRLLLGLQRQDFAQQLGIDLVRYNNVEAKKVRMAEDEFHAVLSKFPEFMPWLTVGGNISLAALRASDNVAVRTIAKKYEDRMLPEGFDLHNRFVA